jgi:hypothetical protein
MAQVTGFPPQADSALPLPDPPKTEYLKPSVSYNMLLEKSS